MESKMKEEGSQRGCMVKPRLIYQFISLSAFEVLHTICTNTKWTARNEARGVKIECTEDKNNRLKDKTSSK